MVHRRSAKLASWQIWLLTLSGSALWLSGSAWLLLHYYGQVKGEFGPEMNPLEPWMMKLHGLVLIPALLGIGGMFVAHIPKGWTHQHQRIAGIALCAFLGLLIISGYMLYYAGAEEVRNWTSIVHWSLGLALPAIFIWHYQNGLRARKRPARP
ncbi:MAG: hypothetical protein ABIM50_09930 [Novosphingobium sp.]